jgi:hypothetical protein
MCPTTTSGLATTAAMRAVGWYADNRWWLE